MNILGFDTALEFLIDLPCPGPPSVSLRACPYVGLWCVYPGPGRSRERGVLVLLQKGPVSLRKPTTAHRLCYLIHLIVFIPEALADLPGLVVKRRGAAGWILTLVPEHILEASTSDKPSELQQGLALYTRIIKRRGCRAHRLPDVLARITSTNIRCASREFFEEEKVMAGRANTSTCKDSVLLQVL
jgi:hypothetical protein